MIFALLAWPELVHRSMREIAEAAGVSPALVHDTLALMRISGYDDHEGNLQASKLLDHWAAAYATTLGPQLEIQRYVGDIASLEDISLSGQILVGGETAVPDLLKPTTGTLYVAAFDHAIAVRRRWRTDGDWNIFVRRKFWREPQGLGSPAYVGNRVPWPLVYADLLSSGDPRLREVAEQLKSEHVETS
ncbi:MAG TPA: type IV toxin-antitoxin system AbiEi family antitoxin [Aeromicrobium sp.]|nr:type IV toxin-antitoxin system AbiEi family antitoxin [Aeromicrobium sp.]